MQMYYEASKTPLRPFPLWFVTVQAFFFCLPFCCCFTNSFSQGFLLPRLIPVKQILCRKHDNITESCSHRVAKSAFLCCEHQGERNSFCKCTQQTGRSSHHGFPSFSFMIFRQTNTFFPFFSLCGTLHAASTATASLLPWPLNPYLESEAFHISPHLLSWPGQPILKLCSLLCISRHLSLHLSHPTPSFHLPSLHHPSS